MPSGEEGAVKSITMANKRVDLARAGDSADITLSDIDAGVLIAGGAALPQKAHQHRVPSMTSWNCETQDSQEYTCSGR